LRILEVKHVNVFFVLQLYTSYNSFHSSVRTNYTQC
jgi:hypothetical protein